MIKKVPFIAMAVGLLLIYAAFGVDKAKKSDFDSAGELIAMRKIANEVLRYTGDSTSPIGPVSRLSPNEFRIQFEHSFSFKPDSLVRIVNKVIAGSKLPSKYIVNVAERKTDKVAWGYGVFGPRQEDITPCLGREQPAKVYYIDIRFEEDRNYLAKGLYTSGFSILGMGLFMFVLTGYKKRSDKQGGEEHLEPVSDKPGIAIGRYVFFTDEQVLRFGDTETILTMKETKILSIFANAPNQVIDRKRLQKEIWEDEGVIVGRSLDMFISRLRKKLENDADVKLLNIHAKGYKLVVSNESV